MIDINNKKELLKLRKKVLDKEFSRMNDAQKEAVFNIKGPLLILAGAGSGKTTVVVNRIANIIKYGEAYNSDYISPSITEEDVAHFENFIKGKQNLEPQIADKLAVYPPKPWRVMAITFTNKAAGELKERISNILGEAGNDVWAATFHSSCARILRRDAERLGYSNRFTIYDTDDSRRLMKECLKELNISEKVQPIRATLSEISKAKDSLKTPKEFAEDAGSDFRLMQISKAYKLYQQKLHAGDAMDFDDLIVNAVKLFMENKDVLDYYQNRFEYMMVDEYQDTNHAQYVFVKLLAEKSKNICVVGDDDQSIYKFRGATIENILSFENTFENAKMIRLEQNYRSTQNILDAANSIIAHNEGRKGKNLWTNNGGGDTITLHNSYNEQEEADDICKQMLELSRDGRNFSEMAVLYRMNSQSLTIERMLTKNGIPHRLLGGTRFYDRAEIKDMLAYLCVIGNVKDEVRLKRIINVPKRGIGSRTIEIVSEIAYQLGESMYDILGRAEEFPMLSKASKKLKSFHTMIEDFRNFAEENPISDLYKKVVEDTNYEQHLKDDLPEKATEKTENTRELLSNILRYEEEAMEADKDATLYEFLEEISLIADIDNYDTSTDAVVLMTVHSAKGLEFPVVFLPGWEEGVFPGNSAVYNPEEVEEERRLAYVAVTRAKEVLHIYHTSQRMIFGSTSRNRMSRFITEIPEEVLDKKESSRAVSNNSFASFNGKSSGFYANTKLPSSPKSTGESYQDGQRVLHKTFGEGIVLSSRPMGNDTLLEIAFEAGTKMLGANFAKLQKI